MSKRIFLLVISIVLALTYQRPIAAAPGSKGQSGIQGTKAASHLHLVDIPAAVMEMFVPLSDREVSYISSIEDQFANPTASPLSGVSFMLTKSSGDGAIRDRIGTEKSDIISKNIIVLQYMRDACHVPLAAIPDLHLTISQISTLGAFANYLAAKDSAAKANTLKSEQLARSSFATGVDRILTPAQISIIPKDPVNLQDFMHPILGIVQIRSDIMRQLTVLSPQDRSIVQGIQDKLVRDTGALRVEDVVDGPVFKKDVRRLNTRANVAVRTVLSASQISDLHRSIPVLNMLMDFCDVNQDTFIALNINSDQLAKLEALANGLSPRRVALWKAETAGRSDLEHQFDAKVKSVLTADQLRVLDGDVSGAEVSTAVVKAE